MVKRTRLHLHPTGLLVLIATAALLAACTSDLDWSGGTVLPGHRSGPVELRPVGEDATISLVGFRDCESDLRALEERRHELREAQERMLMERQDGYYAEETWSDTSESATGDGVMDAGSARASADSSSDLRSDATAGRTNTDAPTLPAGDTQGGAAGSKEDVSTAPSADTSGDVVAGTNVVEANVDEADIIKTDGRRIVTLRGGVLRVTVLDDEPGIDGMLWIEGLGADISMYLIGDTVTLIGREDFPNAGVHDQNQGYDEDVLIDRGMEAPWSQQLILTQVDISDPFDPTVIDSVHVDGSLESTRAVGDRIHVVVTSDSPEVLPRMSRGDETPTSIGGCEDVHYETEIDNPTEIDDPTEVHNPTGVEDSTGTTDAIETTDSAGPRSPTAYATVYGPTISIISFTNLTDGIEPTVITGSGGLVYGSTGSLYIASPLWDRGTDGTAIHRFSLTADGPVDYVGSAVVPGQLLSEFSISEHDSTLRVVTMVEPLQPGVPLWSDLSDDPSIDARATNEALIGPSAEGHPTFDGPRTIDPDRGSGSGDLVDPAAPVTRTLPQEPQPQDPRPTQRSTRITTLRTADMGQLGHLGGLAPGEDLRAVRFIGTMGYVVTFQQVDPLFAIDLADPARPVVLGELEIPGFSEYLHPVGDGLLLGIGRDVDPVTARDEGLKVSLFDVSNPYDPTELDTWTRSFASSPVTYDHHAFTWDPVNHQAIFPVDLPCEANITQPDPETGEMVTRIEQAPVTPTRSGLCNASLVISTRQAQLTEVGWIDHAIDGVAFASPDRAVVVADNIWTVSDVGLGMSPVDDPSRVHLIRW